MGNTWKRGLSMAVCALGCAFVAATCGGREDTWDRDPEVELCGPDPRGCEDALVGSRCGVSDDCEDGVCCLSDNCGGGMCTYLCGGDGDCPPSMLCHEGFCFFDCNTDGDCGPGQSCEHGETVCQY
jgi:hypothetical protein